MADMSMMHVHNADGVCWLCSDAVPWWRELRLRRFGTAEPVYERPRKLTHWQRQRDLMRQLEPVARKAWERHDKPALSGGSIGWQEWMK